MSSFIIIFFGPAHRVASHWTATARRVGIHFELTTNQFAAVNKNPTLSSLFLSLSLSLDEFGRFFISFYLSSFSFVYHLPLDERTNLSLISGTGPPIKKGFFRPRPFVSSSRLTSYRKKYASAVTEIIVIDFDLSLIFFGRSDAVCRRLLFRRGSRRPISDGQSTGHQWRRTYHCLFSSFVFFGSSVPARSARARAPTPATP